MSRSTLTSIALAIPLLAGVVAACSSPDTEGVGQVQLPMALPDDGDDDGPGGDDPPSCTVQSEGFFTPSGGSPGQPGTIALLSTYPASGSTPFDQWLSSQWSSLYGQYQAAGCSGLADGYTLCFWQAGGTIRCAFHLMTPTPPECTTNAGCTGENEQCIGGDCVEVCPDPCAGKCGSVTACGQTYDCGSYCEQGSCNESTHTCLPECSADVGFCIDGVCNPTTLRCEPGCTSSAECPDGKACDTDYSRCEDACTPGDEPPGPDYQCVLGIWRFACSEDNPCPSSNQVCTDGFCYRSKCGEDGSCPAGSHCMSGTDCIANCSGVSCNPPAVCNPENNQCETGDPCAAVVCPTGTCVDGLCVAQGCDGCMFPGQCVGGVCTYPTDPCQGVFCFPGQTCVNGICEEDGGCSWDFDCPPGMECSFGQCIDGGGGEGCVLDGVCSAGESCACDAFCCGGGGSGSGGGEICTYAGSGGISYGQCAACGGAVVWSGGAEVCEMTMSF
ncbi:MAG: hypothetical protein WKG00_38855 [Polyangiaceae bacterium]